MRKKVLVRATGWIMEDDEERAWMDARIKEAALYAQSGGQFDISIQVTVPNEFERMAPVNIGVTAGIETTKVSPAWLEKANIMDRIITISEHSKKTFVDTEYHAEHPETKQKISLCCTSPVEIVHYPAKTFDQLPDLGLKFDHDFNFLVVAQDGPRKNLRNTIKWFVEENIDQRVGLVVKTFIKNNCLTDRKHTEDFVHKVLKKYPERKCKVYLLHGDMSEPEMHALYVHPQIKCLVSLSHGEGFGLPLFEASYSGLPIITTGWSGQCDFLYAPPIGGKRKDFFADQIEGGGELNNEIVVEDLSSKGFEVKKINSHDLSIEELEMCKDYFFIISNFINLSEESKEYLEKNCSYAIYEHDHKYLTTRNPAVYKDYLAPPDAIINYEFYKNAKSVFCQTKFHSEIDFSKRKSGQIFNNRFPHRT